MKIINTESQSVVQGTFVAPFSFVIFVSLTAKVIIVQNKLSVLIFLSLALLLLAPYRGGSRASSEASGSQPRNQNTLLEQSDFLKLS